jgi:hypothetical protein
MIYQKYKVTKLTVIKSKISQLYHKNKVNQVLNLI